jgi:UDPglucose 6-dehydrogenase
VRVGIVGCGHVGLVTASCLTSIGHQVVCGDKNVDTIQTLRAGRIPIYEPHLEEIVTRCRLEGRLTFTNDMAEVVRFADAIFLCISIPQSDNGEVDLTSLESAARLIATECNSPKLVIERSTMPVQTGERLKEMLAVYGRTKKFGFSVAANPQFLREGTAVEDFFHPDRILLGVGDSGSERQLREIYRPILEPNTPCPMHPGGCPHPEPPQILITSVQSAELIKHVSNAFLAMKISYANTIADLCEKLGGDIEEVTRAMGCDPRIGPRFLEAGLGFGGFRLPRDLRALSQLAERVGIPSSLFREIERVNTQRIERLFDKMRQVLWVIKNKRIGILGLSFKAKTDDVRSSPAIGILERLMSEGAEVRAYDPEAMDGTRAIYPAIGLGSSAYEVVLRADALVIATAWDEFRQLDWGRIRDAMARPLVFDGRNLLNAAEMSALGFEYHCLGRGR